MTNTSLTASRTNGLRFSAQLIVTFWASFWSYFLVANLLDNAHTTPASEQTKGYAFIMCGLLVVWGASLLAWRMPQKSGVILLVLGALLSLGYMAWPSPNLLTADRLMTSALLGGLPFLAGVLLWVAHH